MAIEYLDKRHIDKDTIKKFGIGLSIQKVSLTEYLINKKYSIDKLVDVGLTNENGHDIFINRIMFPIYDLSGNPVAFSGRIYNTKDTAKYVNTKETDKFKKGKILYNYHIAKEYLKKNGLTLETSITRNIPQKRMPRKVSRVKNDSVESMNQEYVLIFKK